MNANGLEINFILLTILIIWNIALSIYLFQTVAKYKKLTRGTNNKNLEQVVDKLIDKQNQSISNISQVSQSLIEFQKRSTGFIQKIGLLRFNPFEESGGDNSFAIALLDAEDSGVIISSLHSRSGTRVYTKEVKNGKSTAHTLTKEEKEALDKAVRRK